MKDLRDLTPFTLHHARTTITILSSQRLPPPPPPPAKDPIELSTRRLSMARALQRVLPAPCAYRGTSLIRKRTPLRPYRRLMPRVLGGS